MNIPSCTPSSRRNRLRAGASLLAVAGLSLALASGAHAAVDYHRWQSYLGTESSQYSAYDQINTGNVARLKPAWSYETGPGSPDHFQPLVARGVMYIILHGNTLVALEPGTGKELWKKPLQGRAPAPPGCCRAG